MLVTIAAWLFDRRAFSNFFISWGSVVTGPTEVLSRGSRAGSDEMLCVDSITVSSFDCGYSE